MLVGQLLVARGPRAPRSCAAGDGGRAATPGGPRTLATRSWPTSMVAPSGRSPCVASSSPGRRHVAGRHARDGGHEQRGHRNGPGLAGAGRLGGRDVLRGGGRLAARLVQERPEQPGQGHGSRVSGSTRVTPTTSATRASGGASGSWRHRRGPAWPPSSPPIAMTIFLTRVTGVSGQREEPGANASPATTSTCGCTSCRCRRRRASRGTGPA